MVELSAFQTLNLRQSPASVPSRSRQQAVLRVQPLLRAGIQRNRCRSQRGQPAIEYEHAHLPHIAAQSQRLRTVQSGGGRVGELLGSEVHVPVLGRWRLPGAAAVGLDRHVEAGAIAAPASLEQNVRRIDGDIESDRSRRVVA